MPRSRRNLASLLADLARDPRRPVFVRKTPYRTFRSTAGEIRSTALALAARLDGAGVRPGDRVLLQGPDSPEWCAAFLGIVARGAVAVPLDAGAPPEFSRKVAARVSARAAFLSAGAADALREQVPFLAILENLSPPAGSAAASPEPYRASPEESGKHQFGG